MGPAVSAPGARTVVRRRLVVRGVVQGVGFRPHVAALAADLGLAGWCHNDSGAVEVEVEGPAPDVARFEARLVAEAPPLAVVESVEGTDVPAQRPGDGFRIGSSRTVPGARTMVPPDTATCDQCLAELTDPRDRRYRHPFVTCTHCGPRLTITLDLPYDRAATTMAGFPMCRACAAEYAEPTDRRYHAQPVACHDCGPSLRALAPDGTVVAEGDEPALAAAVRGLRAGAVVAVKGLGGFHLACDAASDAAVAELRAAEAAARPAVRGDGARRRHRAAASCTSGTRPACSARRRGRSCCSRRGRTRRCRAAWRPARRRSGSASSASCSPTPRCTTCSSPTCRTVRPERRRCWS